MTLLLSWPADFEYQKAFGGAWREDGSRQRYNLDTSFWLASATKLITSVAAMQCVERGQLNLDDDVTGHLPELQGVQIITGFDAAGSPILTPAHNNITLR
jgi:CubicO group peptidase (beta-lactamase class C family)